MSFKWFQNNSTVTISFAVPGTVKKQDIDVYITNSGIRAGIKGTPAVCEGQLCSPIKSSKWALKSNMVVIHLEKVTKGKWPSLFAAGGGAQNSKPVVRVIYDYDATDPIELTIREGEIIAVLHQDPSGWWKGELNGKVGLFPHNFVELIPSGGAIEPPEDMNESASSTQEEEVTPPAQEAPMSQARSQIMTPQSVPQQVQPQVQPAVAGGGDEATVRPRLPMMNAPLSMDELKNKLKKRAGGGEDSSSSSPPPNITQPPQNTAPSNPPTPHTQTPTSSSSRPLIRADPPAASVVPGAEPPTSATAATSAPPPAVRKFGNKGASTLSIGAIASGAIAPNTERVAPKEPRAAPLNVLPDTQTTAPATVTPVVIPTAEPTPEQEEPPPKANSRVRAVYEYEAVDEGEIGFAEGTEIEVLTRDTSGWWQGQLPSGQVGWFPANFVEEMAEPEPEPREETVEEKLSKVTSTAERLATPRRAAGNSARRKPSRQGRKAPEKEAEAPASNKSPTKSAKASLPPLPATPPAEEPKVARPKPAPRRTLAPQATPHPMDDTPEQPSTPSSTVAPSVGVPKAAAPRKLAPKGAARPKTDTDEKPAPVAQVATPVAVVPSSTAAASNERPVKPAKVESKDAVVSAKEKAYPSKWPANLGSYEEFCSSLSALCVDDKGLAIATCTVDGVTSFCGNPSYFSLHKAVRPFVYALAARELGRAEMQKVVVFEPSEEDPLAFPQKDALPKALSNAGILSVLGVILSRGSWGSDGRSRVGKMLDLLGNMSGGRVQSSLSTFLALRDVSHQDIAMVHGLKTVGQIPSGVQVGDILDLYFAASSLEVDCRTGATLAATFAAEGINPQSNQKALDAPVIRAVLDLLRPITPEATTVLSVPSTDGSVLLIVPKVLGIVVHASSDQVALEIAKSIAMKFI